MKLKTKKSIKASISKLKARYSKQAPSVKKLLCVLALSLVVCVIHNGRMYMYSDFSSQEDYPKLERIKEIEFPDSIDGFTDYIIEDKANSCKYMVLGTVLNLNETEPIILTATNRKFVATMDFVVEERLVGKVPKRKIKVLIDDDDWEICPKFKKGDRIIISIADIYKGEELDGYDLNGEYNGCFYVSDDDRVYPARLTDANKPLSGESLSKVKRRINYGKNRERTVYMDDDPKLLKKLYPFYDFKWGEYWKYEAE